MTQENSSLKSIYIAKIESISNSSFNREQKEIAKKIISNCDDQDLHNVFNLITQRIKTGFVFDAAPEINHDAVALVKEWKELNINVDGTDMSKGEEKIEHTLIIGENYDALKNLCATYIDKSGKGLVDVIYIDPPYNTDASKADGNDYKEQVESNKFIYRDKFTRDGWLNMMNERLKLARKLLSDKGVIFISIDDSEQAYLKVLCDEIFGEENFVACAPRKTVEHIRVLADYELQSLHDFVLIYCKDLKQISFEKIITGEMSYEFIDDNGNYTLKAFQNSGANGTRKARPNLYYPIYYNESTKEFSLEKQDNFIELLPKKVKTEDGRWLWSKEKFKADSKFLEYKSGTIYRKYYFNEEEDQNKYQAYKTWLDKFPNRLGAKMLSVLGLVGSFDYSKPVSLIKHLLKFSSSPNSLILDFFAGSGTTGQAVMELNAEDGGKRKAILVTNNENSIGEKITRERLYRVINGKGSKDESISWKYSENQPCLKNNSVRVFKIENHQLTLNDLQKAESLKETAKVEFKKLNPAFDTSNDLDIYNELASLNPYKK